jgi:lysozyme family protein
MKLVLGAEGGFSSNPQDPGGALGITHKTLERWRQRRARTSP